MSQENIENRHTQPHKQMNKDRIFHEKFTSISVDLVKNVLKDFVFLSTGANELVSAIFEIDIQSRINETMDTIDYDDKSLDEDDLRDIKMIKKLYDGKDRNKIREELKNLLESFNKSDIFIRTVKCIFPKFKIDLDIDRLFKNVLTHLLMFLFDESIVKREKKWIDINYYNGSRAFNSLETFLTRQSNELIIEINFEIKESDDMVTYYHSSEDELSDEWNEAENDESVMMYSYSSLNLVPLTNKYKIKKKWIKYWKDFSFRSIKLKSKTKSFIENREEMNKNINILSEEYERFLIDFNERYQL